MESAVSPMRERFWRVPPAPRILAGSIPKLNPGPQGVDYLGPQRVGLEKLRRPQPTDALLQQEAREAASGFRAIRRLLQLLLADLAARNIGKETANGRDDGTHRRPRLELRRASLRSAGAVSFAPLEQSGGAFRALVAKIGV